MIVPIVAGALGSVPKRLQQLLKVLKLTEISAAECQKADALLELSIEEIPLHSLGPWEGPDTLRVYQYTII